MVRLLHAGLDLPEHVLAVHLVAWREYDAGPDYHGHLFLQSVWAPYSLLYVLAGPLVRLTNATVALKAAMTLCWVGTAFALRYLLRVLRRDSFGFYWAFPFLFSTTYLAGFFSYLFAFPIAILVIADAVARPETMVRRLLYRLAGLLVLVWAHPMLYVGTAAVLAAVLTRDLAKRRAPLSNWCLAAIWLAAPAAYLAAWTPTLTISSRFTWQQKLQHFWEFFFNTGAYELRAFDQYFWLPKLPLLAWLAYVVWSKVHGPRSEVETGYQAQCSKLQAPADSRQAPVAGLFWGIVVLLLLAIVLPERFSEQMITAGLRFGPLAALLAAPLLPSFATRPRMARCLLVLWCFAVLAANGVLTWRYDRGMDGFNHLASIMEPRQSVMMTYEGPENLLYYHVIAYYHVQKGGLNPHSFFAKPEVAHFPAQLTPPFPWGRVELANAWDDAAFRPVSRAFRYIMAKTSRGQGVPTPDLPFHRLVARDGGWLLFERVP